MRVWEDREERIYPELFGAYSKGIYPLTADILTRLFKQESINPRWLHYGVFQFAPTDRRRSWLYVTSGMSNAWEDDSPNPASVSGLGCEFLLETTGESEWAIHRLLHLMAFQILLAHGRYPDREMLGEFDRLPLRAPIVGDSQLTWLMIAPPIGVPEEVRLDSGTFRFSHVVSLTEVEVAHARTAGAADLLDRLSRAGFYPLIDVSRESVIPEVPANKRPDR